MQPEPRPQWVSRRLEHYLPAAERIEATTELIYSLLVYALVCDNIGKEYPTSPVIDGHDGEFLPVVIGTTGKPIVTDDLRLVIDPVCTRSVRGFLATGAEACVTP